MPIVRLETTLFPAVAFGNKLR